MPKLLEVTLVFGPPKRGGRTLTWDPVGQQVAGDAEANLFLTRRRAWIHPSPSRV